MLAVPDIRCLWSFVQLLGSFVELLGSLSKASPMLPSGISQMLLCELLRGFPRASEKLPQSISEASPQILVRVFKFSFRFLRGSHAEFGWSSVLVGSCHASLSFALELQERHMLSALPAMRGVFGLILHWLPAFLQLFWSALSLPSFRILHSNIQISVVRGASCSFSEASWSFSEACLRLLQCFASEVCKRCLDVSQELSRVSPKASERLPQSISEAFLRILVACRIFF
jgi:hypothetical protein